MKRSLAPALALVAALGLFSGPAGAQSGVIKENYLGCLSEDYLDQLFTALNNEDKRLTESLVNKVCFFIKGREFSMLDRGLLTSKIRVYAGGDHVDLWVPSEATR